MYRKDYYEANKETLLKHYKKYKQKNKEKVKLSNKKYRELNKENRATLERARRARKRNSETEKYSVTDVLDKYGSNCHICGLEVDLTAERRSGRKGWEYGLHIDHLIEISSGGPDILDNVRPAHGLCNLQRNNRKRILVNNQH